MRSTTLKAPVLPEPTYHVSARWRHWPQPVLARDDTLGSDKQAEPAIRILVVEDNFVVATGIEGALSEAGFDVVGVAISADEAVALAESHKPYLIVMDVRLAGERDGINAAVEIFQKLGIRCVFATAHYDEQSLERAKQAMPLGWLRKPYAMVSLVNAVRGALNELGRRS
jgi:two-component system, response regulator PdtaR